VHVNPLAWIPYTQNPSQGVAPKNPVKDMLEIILSDRSLVK
jgi:hypothetical protein